MKSIKIVFALIIAGVTCVIFGAQTTLSLTQFNSFAIERIQKELILQTDKEAYALNTTFKEAADGAIAISHLVASQQQADEVVHVEFLKRMVSKNPDFSSASIALEPEYIPGFKAYCRIIVKDKSGKFEQYTDKQFDYRNMDYYKAVLETNKPVLYTDPTQGRDPNLIWITCSVPIVKNEKKVGAVSIDLTLDAFENLLSNIKVGQSGYAFAIDKKGYYLGNYAEKNGVVTKKLSEKITEDADTELKELGDTIFTSGKSGIAKLTGKNVFAVYSPIGDTGLTLVLMYPVAEINASLMKLLYSNVGMILIAILCLVGVMIFMVNRRIINPLVNLSIAVERVASGNLKISTIDYKKNDEIGKTVVAFSCMTDNLRRMTMEIAKVSEQVAATSQELHSTSEQSSDVASQIAGITGALSAHSMQQEDEARRTITSLQEMSDAISHVAKTASDIAAMSVEATQVAQAGGRMVTTTNEQIQSISQDVGQAAQAVVKLGESSQQISEIVTVISTIAGQTNLLALNAAIEAARAGEHGRGFAVVAEEVRKLAEQSQAAAKRIAAIISEIGKEGDNVVAVMEVSTREVTRGAEVIMSSGEKFKQIIEHVQLLNLKIQEITAAAEELSASSDGVLAFAERAGERTAETANSIHAIAATMDEQSASINKMADSSENMAAMAEKLNLLIRRFKM
ncbi:methyl-accepting chemotaxis protein [Sporomusa sp.]|uniref:methyl-accepting chemotaxis protein n=1 Tax=Sporomusa sp. TaxID=2078658 RepID=UPI002BBB0F74|nr:methyl-accepting chemotaxis protein [Sporomusa sp.]HWR07183.1 methyl-accepting chemotaxis protein [Sporomusa sp.]